MHKGDETQSHVISNICSVDTAYFSFPQGQNARSRVEQENKNDTSEYQMALGELKKLRDDLCGDSVKKDTNKTLGKIIFMICAVVITAFAAISIKKKGGVRYVRNADPLFQMF